MKRIKTLFAMLVLALSLAQSAHAITVWYQPMPLPSPLPNGATESNYHIRDGWLNNYYPAIKIFQDTAELKIGGWGDTYLSLLRFDTEGLPKDVTNAYLYLYSLSRNGAYPSQVALYRASSAWNTTVQWGDPNTSGVLEPYSTIPPSTLPSTDAGYAYSPSPAENSFYGMWITPFYNGWKTTPSSNYGLVIYPNDGNNYQFDYFVSSNGADDGKRPILRLDFDPTLVLKMPFEAYNWNVGTEIGGLGCAILHTGHTGNYYFAIDFEWRAKRADGSMRYSSPTAENIPILAAAEGTVVSVEHNSSGFGESVVIEHGATGIRTRYSHMKIMSSGASSIPPEIYTGVIVPQGKRFGYMGTTGSSTGVHLDFTVSSKEADGLWKSTKDRPSLAKIIMEGQLLKSYQVDKCAGGVSNRYYPSSNLMVP